MQFLGEAEISTRELKFETGQILGFNIIDHECKSEIDVRVIIEGVEEENKNLILDVLPGDTTIRIYEMQVDECFYRAKFDDSLQEKINEVLNVYETVQYEIELTNLNYEFVSGGIDFIAVPVRNNVELNFHVSNPLVSSSFRLSENFFKKVFALKNLKLKLDIAYNKFKQIIPSKINIDSSELDDCIKDLLNERKKTKKLKSREISLQNCSFDNGCLFNLHKDVLFRNKIKIEIKHELFKCLKGESAKQFLMNLGIRTFKIQIRFTFDHNMNVNFEEFSCDDLDKYFDLLINVGFEFKSDILLENISIENGGVRINFPELGEDLTAWIANPDLLEIHDTIKPLILKSINKEKLVYRGKLIFNEEGKARIVSGNCEALNNIKLPQIRQIYFADWMKSFEKESSEKKDLKPLQDEHGILPTKASDLIDLLSENLKFKHEKYLKVLCENHHDESALFMTHTPTAFMFSIEKKSHWHFVFETVDTSNATYIWTIEKVLQSNKKDISAIAEGEVGKLILIGRQNYRKTKPKNCTIIHHIDDNHENSLKLWNKSLLEVLESN